MLRLFFITLLSILLFSIQVQSKSYTVEDVSSVQIVTCADGFTHIIDPRAASVGFCKLISENAPCANTFNIGFPMSFVATSSPPKLTFNSVVTNRIIRDYPLTIVYGRKTAPVAKIQYFIEVDKFSLLDILNSNGTQQFDPYYDKSELTAAEVEDVESIGIAVEFMGRVSKPLNRAYFFRDDKDPETKYSGTSNTDRLIAPYYTLIINAERGEVTSLEWENSCLGCYFDDKCMENIQVCGVPINDCNTPNNPESDISCSIKIYVAWKGTDANGNFMLSGQQTMANFRMFSARFAYDAAASTARDLTANIPPIDGGNMKWPNISFPTFN